jgi:hypothetical protein
VIDRLHAPLSCQIDAAMGHQAWKIIGLLRLAPIVP